MIPARIPYRQTFQRSPNVAKGPGTRGNVTNGKRSKKKTRRIAGFSV